MSWIRGAAWAKLARLGASCRCHSGRGNGLRHPGLNSCIKTAVLSPQL